MSAGEDDEQWHERPRIVAVIVMAIIVVILFAGGCGSSEGSSKPSSVQPRRTDAEVTLLFAGIPQHGNVLGYPRAPLTLQYFADLQCPYCRRFTLGVLPSLITSYVRHGKLKIEYRSLQTATRSSETFELQQVAALAAGKQNKMWDFIDLFYREQGRERSGYVSERYLDALAQRLAGLSLIEWTAARNDPELVQAITSDAQAASNAGIRRTPSFLLITASHTPNGRHTPDASAIERLLRG
jgi:hypothetical protein